MVKRNARILLWVGAGVVAVLVVTLLAVQVALFTPLPRAIVENALTDALDRRARMDSIDVGWGRTSKLHNLCVLSRDLRHVALYIPDVEAKHPTLPVMLLGNHSITSFTARNVEVRRHVTWLRLGTVAGSYADHRTKLNLDIAGDANGRITISDLDKPDKAGLVIDLQAPAGATDPPFQSLHLDARLVDNKVTAMRINIDRLNLGPLMLTVSPSVGQVYGQLSGEVELTLPDGELARATGSGHATVVDSDFVDIPLFASIYDVLRLKSSATERNGKGDVAFRLEDGTLFIDEMEYTNRGAYIEIAGRITDPSLGGEAGIDAYAVASLKPLPDKFALKLVNNLLSLIQEQVSTLHVTGTIAEEKLQPVPLKSVGDSISQLLGVKSTQDPAKEPAP